MYTPLVGFAAALSVGMAALASLSAAGDMWVEARTAHSVVVSDAGPEVARQLADQLELIRDVIRSATGNAAADPHEPVVVLAVKNQNRLRELLPQFWERRGARPAAAASPGPYTPYIAIRVDRPVAERYRLLLHEYVHLVTRATVPDVPAWLDEGLSEFWATLRLRDGAIEVGQPVPQHLKALQSTSWIPIAELVAIPRGRYPSDRGKAQILYAQSWALVHYLFTKSQVPGPKPGYAPVLPMDLSSLEREVKEYVRGGLKPSRLHAFTPSRLAGARQRVLSEAEALAIRGSFLVHGERPAAALPLLKAALAAVPEEALALEGMGTYFFLSNDADQARLWFKKAIESGSAGYRAHYYYAVLMAADQSTAELHLRRALELNPDFEPARDRLRGGDSQGFGGFCLPLATAVWQTCTNSMSGVPRRKGNCA